MICPKCKALECLVEEDKDITAYFCMGCGYRTRSDYSTKYFDFQPTVIKMNSTTKQMVWKDPATGLYWFPINFDIPKVGILYPKGTVDNMEWIYMPMIELTDAEARKMPGKKEKPDDYKKKTFNSTNIKEALKLLKVID